MSYDKTPTRVWALTSDNSGVVLNTEFRRIDANISEMMDGLAKSDAYLIDAADKIGIVRVTNAITKETTKAFSAATPSVVSDVAHGLVNGDTIMVSGSTVPAEIGNVHYTVTRITDDTFSLDGTVNAAGGGGNLDWRKDAVITLPAAASHTDNEYTVMKVDANEGAVALTDGSTKYFMFGQNDIVKVKSDGTNWIKIDTVPRGGIALAEQVKEYVLTTPLDVTGRFAGIGGAFANFMIPELPQDTVAVTLIHQLTNNGDASTTVGIDVSTSTGTQILSVQAEHEPVADFVGAKGISTILTEQSGGAGNIIRAKRVGTSLILSLRILGYKVRI